MSVRKSGSLEIMRAGLPVDCLVVCPPFEFDVIWGVSHKVSANQDGGEIPSLKHSLKREDFLVT